MGTRHYELRLFDRTLVEFSIADGLFGPEVEVADWDTTAQMLMPCGLSLTSEGLWGWLESRSIPANRRNAAKICTGLGFVLGDIEALYQTSMGLSLNDSYWVVPRGFSGQFDDYNLCDNSFSEAIGALAVAGELRGTSLHGNTPELTTDGTLRKGWRIVDGRRLLYKGSSEGYVPGEPWSEYLAALIGKDLGLNVVDYGIDTWQGETCSTCEDFASKDVSYVPFAVATGATDLVGVLWWCACWGDRCLEELCDMFAFDALLCNTDRHLTNFGILRDNATGRPLGLAPIFDNGRSLFPNVADDDSGQFMLEAQLRSPAFGGRDFSEFISRTMGKRQLELLGRASDRGIVGNVLAPNRRVAALDEFVRRRAEELAKTSPVDHEELKRALRSAWARRPAAPDDAHRLRPN